MDAGAYWSRRNDVGRYVVVRDREHAKVAIESGLLFWVNWTNKERVRTHWLQFKADTEFAMTLERGCWGILVEDDE